MRSSSQWRGKRVAVLGGPGFIGSYVVEQLEAAGADVRVVCRSASHFDRFLAHLRGRVEMREADCSVREEACRAVRGCDVALDLAATVAGIAMNRNRPAQMFASNASLVVPIFEACVAEDVGRVLYVSSACVYPNHAPVPTPEEEGFVGDPELTNLGYGWSKRMGEVAARLYAAEYGLSVAVVRPYNAYGPRDEFGLATAHVIPSLIRRAEEESGGELVVWGSGKQTRSFIFAADLAQGMLLAAERAPNAVPINLGSAEEVTIGDLARLIVELAGSGKRVVFDTGKPDGHVRRQPDHRRASELLGFTAPTPLREGLARTIAYYRRIRGQLSVA